MLLITVGARFKMAGAVEAFIHGLVADDKGVQAGVMFDGFRNRRPHFAAVCPRRLYRCQDIVFGLIQMNPGIAAGIGSVQIFADPLLLLVRNLVAGGQKEREPFGFGHGAVGIQKIHQGLGVLGIGIKHRTVDSALGRDDLTLITVTRKMMEQKIQECSRVLRFLLWRIVEHIQQGAHGDAHVVGA